jgi:hypothetical protein
VVLIDEATQALEAVRVYFSSDNGPKPNSVSMLGVLDTYSQSEKIDSRWGSYAIAAHNSLYRQGWEGEKE